MTDIPANFDDQDVTQTASAIESFPCLTFLSGTPSQIILHPNSNGRRAQSCSVFLPITRKNPRSHSISRSLIEIFRGLLSSSSAAMLIQRYISQCFKPCHPRIRIPIVVMILITITLLTIQSSSVFSPNDLIRELGKKFMPGSSHSEISPSPSPSLSPTPAPTPSPTSAPEVNYRPNPSPLPQSPIAPIVDHASSPAPLPRGTDYLNGTSISPPVAPPESHPETPNKEENPTKSPPRECITDNDAWKRRNSNRVISVREMDDILVRNQASSCSKVPRWPSTVDEEILWARNEILNAPIAEEDPELYPPIYRNVSIFKRSYELMEKMLKVYVYKEGEKPIFHEPILGGIYAAEGWFMKHMEGKNRFVVDNPEKAHLFYMPFSSTKLRVNLFDSKNDPHKRRLVKFLETYISTISQKYPYWSRTGGADHFSVACHDWASKLTARTMGNSIRVLCNADLAGVFELGKDVSFTLTAVRNVKDPAQDARGKPGEKRDVLAFFAGQMHGYVRPVLLQYWGNDDPDIKVFGPLKKGRRWDTSVYLDYMRRAKFCLCPRGYQANSPRLAEAIFFQCVPVIISDNLVPPFFEIFKWEAFSVEVAVKDIPKLKEILLAIPREKYLALHRGVLAVQKHFLWHPQPKKYDLFHTTLHSVWFNRVLQLKVH